jgi:hypothetical protein
MPARSNAFQQIVKYIYEQISAGATVTESGMLRERDGTEREVDILIEWKYAGVDFQMAVECRDYTRKQNIQWVDQLIGKFEDLKVNKIVAISSSPFAKSSKRKARAHNIEVITVNEALTKDWRADIERWKFMTHSFTLMRITTFKANGEIFTDTEIAADGQTETHRDEMSAAMHNILKPYFMDHMSKEVGAALKAKIKENWQRYCTDTTPRWATVVIPRPGLMQYGKPLDVERIVFGVGTFFHVGSPNNHFALREHSLSKVSIKTMNADAELKLVFDREAKPLTIDYGDGKVFRIRPSGAS